MMLYEKPDPTRYPNTQTRPDPKPEKVQPATPLPPTRMEMSNASKNSIKLLFYLGTLFDHFFCPEWQNDSKYNVCNLQIVQS